MSENTFVDRARGNLGFDGLDDDVWEALLPYSHFLLSKYSDDLEFFWTAYGEKLAEFYEGIGRKDLSQKAMDALGGRVRVEPHLFPCMLLAIPRGSTPAWAELERAKAIYFAVGLALSFDDRNSSAANSASREVRMLARGKFKQHTCAIYEVIGAESIGSTMLDPLIRKIRKESGDESIVRRLERMRVPLIDVFKDRGDRGREVIRGVEYSQRNIEFAVKILNEHGEVEVEIERHRNVEIGVPEGDSFKESLYDHPYEEELVVVRDNKPNVSRQSVAMQKRKSTGCVNRLIRTSQMNPCGNEVLDTGTVAKSLEIICDSGTSEAACAVAGVSLATGRSTERVISLLSRELNEYQEKLLQRKGAYVLGNTITLPYSHLEGSLHSRAMRRDNELYLAIPNRFWAPLTSAINAYSNDKDSFRSKIEADLKELNSKIYASTHQQATLSRLSNYLQFSGKRAGLDTVDVANMVGISAEQCPECFYDLTDVSETTEFHIQFLENIFDRTPIDLKFYENIRTVNRKVGSYLSFEVGEAREFIELLLSKVNCPRPSSVEEWCVSYNWRILYVYQVLALATALRGIRAAFQYVSDFDLRRGLVWVNDKQQREGLSARILPIPAIVVCLVKWLIEHQKGLGSQLKYLEPALSESILGSSVSRPDKNLFNGSSFLSVIKKKARGYMCEPLTPSFLLETNEWGPKRPANWQRHFIRQQLKLRGVSTQGLKYLLGHAGFGEEAEGIWSGWTMAESRILTEQVELVLEDIGVQQLR